MPEQAHLGGNARKMNIAMILEMAADTFGDRVAVSDGRTSLTYVELRQRALAAAEIVKGNGSRNTALLDVNSTAIPVALFGAALGGTAYAPVNYRLARDELSQLLERITPATLFTTGEAFAGLIAPDGMILTDRDRLPAGDGVERAWPDLSGDGSEIAVHLFTSGTTGKPKAAILRHENVVSYILGTVEFASALEGDTSLISVPPYHIAGISQVLTATYAGRRMVFLENFEARAWLDLCAAERVTNAFVVPTMLVRIIDELAHGSWDLSALKAVSFGGGKMPLAVIERAMALLSKVDFTNAYGLTETSATICLLTPEDHRAAAASPEPHVRRRLGSVGRAIGTVEIEIRDEDGRVLPPGAPGQVHARGAQVAGEYLGTGSTLDADGWFLTRDRGFLDADGFLFLEGRDDDVIVRGGENISPGEIEDVLLEHPAILDVGVVAVPDEYWGEAIGAVIVTRTGQAIAEDEVQDWVRARLRSSRVPSVVRFRAELPYNETGKLLRRVIRGEMI
jgi:acyl-CoA synthetase (AMP-forming)/AMP-acid ligase II